MLISYHIIFPIIFFHFISLSNLKTSKKSANLVRASFFGGTLKIHPNSMYFFWNAKWPSFREKNTLFKIKHPDNTFGKIGVAKIERSGYKMKLNFMKKVPLSKRSKIEQNRFVLAIFWRRTKFDQFWNYRKYKRLSEDMIKTKICLKTCNFRFHFREFSPPQAAKMGFTSLFQKALF